jgi:hypothetical protein
MTENRVDMTITQEQRTAVLAAWKTIEENLPGLIELTAEQRKGMSRYSEGDLAMIFKAKIIAEKHPEILPAGFSMDEMGRDVDTLQVLDEILLVGRRIIGHLEDTRFAAAREAQGHGRSIYQFLKTYNKLTGKLKDVLDDLASFFAHSTPTKPNPPAGS